MTVPINIGPGGAIPRLPQDILNQLIASVSSLNPGYTATLPGSLIRDISTTDVAAIAQCDADLIEFVNAIGAANANAFILNMLGQLLGVPLGVGSNTSVFVTFSGTVGYPISPGFVVSDGTSQYTIMDGGIIGSNGSSLPLYALAVNPGVFAVPVNTVTNLVTSVPSSITLTCTNATQGTPGTNVQSESDYRTQVMQAYRAASQGMGTYLRTLLGQVPGVQARLVSVIQVPNNGGWEILVGGGDPYQVADAIRRSLFDINTLVGSTLAVTNISNANPGVVTTNLNHGFSNGQVINITGVVGMSGINNVALTVTVIDRKNFSIGINTTFSGAYASGGVITPNFRNLVVSINDYPNTYSIPIVIPPQQTVTMTVTWNTISTNLISQAAIAQAASTAIASYVNSIYAGQPMNQFELIATFQDAVVNILPTQLLTRLIFSVSINGVLTAPAVGTGVISGDPESYFFTTPAQITINQG